LNYYISEYLVLRSYARYYSDDWGIQSKTLQFELPIRFNLSWKFTPIYRYYDQTAADYFGPYNTHLSSQEFYTSDYDLSDFSSHQWGASLSYRSVLSQLKIVDFGLNLLSYAHSIIQEVTVYRPLLYRLLSNLFWINRLSHLQ